MRSCRDVGAVAAFHVSERAWLLTFFPSVAPSFPGGAIALLGAVLAVLLTGFEVNRRKAEREADRAARALGEKQNLLNTMQVPLIVVDPNTDEIVSANQVAESIGIRRGARFADRVSPEPAGARALRADAGRDQRGQAALRRADPGRDRRRRRHGSIRDRPIGRGHRSDRSARRRRTASSRDPLSGRSGVGFAAAAGGRRGRRAHRRAAATRRAAVARPRLAGRRAATHRRRGRTGVRPRSDPALAGGISAAAHPRHRMAARPLAHCAAAPRLRGRRRTGARDAGLAGANLRRGPAGHGSARPSWLGERAAGRRSPRSCHLLPRSIGRRNSR